MSIVRVLDTMLMQFTVNGSLKSNGSVDNNKKINFFIIYNLLVLSQRHDKT